MYKYYEETTKYRYLYAPKGITKKDRLYDYAEFDTLFRKAMKKGLNSPLIIRVEKNEQSTSRRQTTIYEKSHYEVFGNFEHFEERFNKEITRDGDYWGCSLHEVIIGEFRQKLKFDIDGTRSKFQKIIDSGILDKSIEEWKQESVASQLADWELEKKQTLSEEIKTVKAEGMDLEAMDFDAVDLDDLDTLEIDLEEIEPEPEHVPVFEPKEYPISRAAEDTLKIIIREIAEVLMSKYRETFIYYSRIYNNLLLTSSCGITPEKREKFSFHIVLDNYYLDNCKEAEALTEEIMSRLHPAVSDLLDAGVNAKTHNFRMLGFGKRDDLKRIKRIDPELCNRLGLQSNFTLQQSLITNVSNSQAIKPLIIDSKELSRRNKIKLSEPVEITDELVQKVIDFTESNTKLLEFHQYRELQGNLLLFDRMGSSFCDICQRYHDADNTLIVSISGGEDDAVKVFENCRKAKGKGRLLGVIQDKKLKEIYYQRKERTKPKLSIEEYRRKFINGLLIDSKKNTPNNISTLADTMKFLPINCEDLPNLDDLVPAYKDLDASNSNTLFVRSLKGTGKTQSISRLINDLPDDWCVIVLSARRCLATQYREIFKDFDLYSSIEDKIIPLDSYSKLIIQIESIHRLWPVDVAKFADKTLLILDEIESLESQIINSPHVRDHYRTIALYELLVTGSKHVIALDANMTVDTIMNVAILRPDSESTIIHNTAVRNALDVTVHACGWSWYKKLKEDLQNGLRIVVASNSASACRGIYNFVIDAGVPIDKCKLFTADNSDELVEMSKTLGQSLIKYDVIIYSPVISSGLSFTEKHFDKLYCHFGHHSCDAFTCDQMMGRVRDFSTGKCELFINYKNRTEPFLGRAKIQELFMTSSSQILDRSLAELFRDAPVDCYNSKGFPSLIQSNNKLRMWLNTKTKENFIRSATEKALIDTLVANGHSVKVFEQAKKPTDPKCPDAKLIREAKEQRAIDIAMVNPLTEEEKEALFNKKKIKSERNIAIEKHMMTEAYGIKETDVNKSVVIKYNTPVMKSKFYNIVHRLHLSPMELDREFIRKKIKGEPGEVYAINDLADIYYPDKHRMTFEILNKVFGREDNPISANDIVKGLQIRREDLEKNIVAMAKYFEENIQIITRLFKVRVAKNVKWGEFQNIKTINSFISVLYGLRIRSDKRGKAGMSPNCEYRLIFDKFTVIDLEKSQSENVQEYIETAKELLQYGTITKYLPILNLADDKKFKDKAHCF